MDGSLPTNAIALIFALMSGAGLLIWRLQNKSIEAQQQNAKMFTDYIEKKNGIVLKQADIFAEALKEQSERHQKMMDEFTTRLERTLPVKQKRHAK